MIFILYLAGFILMFIVISFIWFVDQRYETNKRAIYICHICRRPLKKMGNYYHKKKDKLIRWCRCRD